MNYTHAVTSAFIENWWFFAFLIFVLFLSLFPRKKSAKIKGRIGEHKVNKLTVQSLNPEIYHLIKDVTLPTRTGTTQIDHIIVSTYGIFVVETKNMGGWIFGSERGKQWTQTLYKEKYFFQNPLHQNYKHLKTLQRLLNLKERQFHSIVVFTDKSEFKTDMPRNVLKTKNYIAYVKSKKTVLILPSEVEWLVRKIESVSFPRTSKTRKKHAENVKKIICNK